MVGDTDEGNAAVAFSAGSATSGQPITTTLTLSGLDPSKRYLGLVGYVAGADTVGSTVVSVG